MTAVVVTAFALGIGMWWLAAAYESIQTTVRRVLGFVLTVVGHSAVLAAFLLQLFAVKKNQCGQPTGAASDWMQWLFFGGLVALMFSAVATRATTWLPAAVTAIFDASFVSVFLVQPTPHWPLLIAVLATHSFCSAAAAWFSWRARGLLPHNRAKASEAARTLAGAWLVFLILVGGSTGEAGSNKLVTNGTFAGIFVISAVGLVLGPGYTKYAEAMATRSGKPPVADGWIGVIRDWLTSGTVCCYYVVRTLPMRRHGLLKRLSSVSATRLRRRATDSWEHNRQPGHSVELN